MKPKYLDDVIKQCRDKSPGVYEIGVLHDDWCDLLNAKGRCNCEPEVLPGSKVMQK